MYSKLVAFGSALLLAGVLSSPAPAQESAAEKAREKQADTAAAGMPTKNRVCLLHSRIFVKPKKNWRRPITNMGHQQQALKHVQQAEQSVLAGIQSYNANVLNKKYCARI